MIDYTVNYWSGFYHIMQCCRMTEVCWNNNKQMFFQCRQTLHWWGVRLTSSCLRVAGSLIDVPIMIPAFFEHLEEIYISPIITHCLMITYRHKKITNLLHCEEKCVSLATCAHTRSKLIQAYLYLSLMVFSVLLSPYPDVRTVWRCCLCVARVTACSVTRPWGRAISACSSSKTRL